MKSISIDKLSHIEHCFNCLHCKQVGKAAHCSLNVWRGVTDVEILSRDLRYAEYAHNCASYDSLTED